jgi:valyl-tRNA synthetase
MEIPKILNNEIWDYCRINNITNIDDFTIKLVRQGFTVEKFGATPTTIEKVVEKIVEVVVEKEVLVTNDSESNILNDKIMELEKKLESVKKELEEEKKKNKTDLYGE